MKSFIFVILIILCYCFSIFAQDFNWTDISINYSLLEGIRLYQGICATPKLNAWYLDVDMNNEDIAIRPYLAEIPAGKEGVAYFSERVGAIAAVNGGYFNVNGSSSYSTVVYPNEVLAQNVASLNRDGTLYPVTRSFLGITRQKKISIDWIYHFSNTVSDIYRFEQPTPNSSGSPAPTPVRDNGTPYKDLWLGLGGGPTLIEKGEIQITYSEEVFWGSGIGYETLNPRTAVGYTADNHVILLVVDGRQSESVGVGLPELAQTMHRLNCIEAMNLDGGGSTQMAVGKILINRPEGGVSQRPVPTILAVVHADSIPKPRLPLLEKIIDTSDPLCTLYGSGWFPSANPGYWSTTPAMLHQRGNGEAYALFRAALKPAMYEIYGWWVAAFNRCTDTPFIIHHQNGVDTITVDQTMNGSKWNLIGSYQFYGDTSDAVIISDAATKGTYIVADAIRFVTYDTSSTSSVRLIDKTAPQKSYQLEQNYPNPFNSATKIVFSLLESEAITLKIYNLLGEEIFTLIDEMKEAGHYEYVFQAADLSSGIYLYSLTGTNFFEIKKMIFIK